MVSNGVAKKPTRLIIVGTATMPAIGTQKPHLEMGTGALLDYARRSLSRIDATLNASPDSAGGVVGVLRQAEIANYRSIGALPGLLGGAVVVGAVIALGLTLVASVRRRRRELAC
jgi:hypothetical protein